MTAENRSVFDIMDGIIDQVNKTRIIFTILLAVVILPLAVFSILFFVVDFDTYYHDSENMESGYLWDSLISLLVIAVVALAIRQLIALNSWTKKYKKFKARQQELKEEINKELEED